jgi:hypothetical protein
MLKISRIRPCEYNKSCSILHNKSNKIGFAFFRIFYDFLRILQVSAKWIYYWRCSFASRPSKRFRTTQLGPSTHGTAGSPEIRRLRRCSRPGKGSGRTTSSPRTRWCSAFGRRRHRRRCAAMAGGNGRGGSGCGEVQRAAVEARGWSKGGLGGFGRRRERAERRAHRRRRQWRSTAGMAWRGGGNGGLK